jgi:hypothetical protein
MLPFIEVGPEQHSKGAKDYKESRQQSRQHGGEFPLTVWRLFTQALRASADRRRDGCGVNY